MAISNDRVSSSPIAKIAAANLNSASESGVSNSVSKKVKEVKKSILDNKEYKVEESGVLSSLGVFGDLLCGDLKPLQFRKSDGLLNLLKNLNFGLDFNLCGESKSNIDKTLSKVPNLKIKKSIIPVDKEPLLDKIIASSLKSSMTGLGLGTKPPACISNKSKGNLVSLLGPLGGSLKQKVKLGNLFNVQSNTCATDALKASESNPLLASVAAAGTIDVLSKMDMNSAVDYTKTVSKDPVKRKEYLSGFNLALKNKEDNNIENKLLLLEAAKLNNSDPKTSLTENIYTRGNTELVLGNISKSSKTSTSPVSDYHYLNRSLDTIDPNWKNEGGSTTPPNLYKTKGNKRMSEVSNSYLAHKSSDNRTLGASIATTIDTATAIRLNNLV